MTEIDTSTAEIEWPRAIWAGERRPDEISGYHVFSKHATIPRFDGDIDREREFHFYVDADIFDSKQRYHEHQRAALAAERDAAVARAERAEARVAELEAEVERLRAALGAEQDSADEMADVLSACGDGLMFDVDRLQAALDQHDALREAALSSSPMPAAAASALDRMTAQARAQGMREAAEIAQARAQGMLEAAEIAAHRYAVCEDAYSKGLGEEERHCALEAKHIEDKIRARAEEILKEKEA